MMQRPEIRPALHDWAYRHRHWPDESEFWWLLDHRWTLTGEEKAAIETAWRDEQMSLESSQSLERSVPNSEREPSLADIYLQYRDAVWDAFPYLEEDTIRWMFECDKERHPYSHDLYTQQWADLFQWQGMSKEAYEWFEKYEPEVIWQAKKLSRNQFRAWLQSINYLPALELTPSRLESAENQDEHVV